MVESQRADLSPVDWNPQRWHYRAVVSQAVFLARFRAAVNFTGPPYKLLASETVRLPTFAFECGMHEAATSG